MNARIVMLSVVVTLLGVASMSSSQDPPGKKLFLDAKCNGCHSVESQGIEAVRDNSKAPDMSNAGTELPSPEWAKKFVTREEAKDGKKHQRPWKGSDKELSQIVDWLMTLKIS